jgi:chromosome segregation ATPase
MGNNRESKSSSPGKTYKSPRRKLVKFFEKSRDQWKFKCREAKALVKRLKNRVRYLESIRDHWKQRSQALEAELAQVKAETAVRQKELEALKKSRLEKPCAKLS